MTIIIKLGEHYSSDGLPIECHYDYDQLSDLVEILLTLLSEMEDFQQKKKIPFQCIYGVIRITTLDELFESHFDGENVLTGLYIQPKGILSINENHQVGIYRSIIDGYDHYERN